MPEDVGRLAGDLLRKLVEALPLVEGGERALPGGRVVLAALVVAGLGDDAIGVRAGAGAIAELARAGTALVPGHLLEQERCRNRFDDRRVVGDSLADFAQAFFPI